MAPPPGVVLPFQPVRLVGTRALISGHGPKNPDGSIAAPLGKLGRELTSNRATTPHAAPRSRSSAASRALGDLDRVSAWTRVFGMVNSAAGFNQQPSVINGFSTSSSSSTAPTSVHSHSAVGLAELPFDIPVEIDGEVEIDG